MTRATQTLSPIISKRLVMFLETISIVVTLCCSLGQPLNGSEEKL